MVATRRTKWAQSANFQKGEVKYLMSFGAERLKTGDIFPNGARDQWTIPGESLNFKMLILRKTGFQ